MRGKVIIVLAALFGVIGVGAGAIGAHLLSPILSEKMYTGFLTATRFNMYHAIVLLIIPVLIQYLDPTWAKISSYCFVVGILFFSGIIYVTSFATLWGEGKTLKSALGPIVPMGGFAFILGWISIGIGMLKNRFIVIEL